MKIQTHSTGSKKESGSVQILTAVDVKSEISQLAKLVEDSKTDQKLVNTVHLVVQFCIRGLVYTSNCIHCSCRKFKLVLLKS